VAGRLGRDHRTSPTTISPVVPEIEMTSPSLHDWPSATKCYRAEVDLERLRAADRGLAHCRAQTTAASTRGRRVT
jgi:hypothetical protein